MGSIRKRNHQWNAQVRIKGWQPLSKTFQTKRQAQQWIQETETAIRSKELGIAERPNLTLAEACELYTRTISANHKGHHIEAYRLAKIASAAIGTLQLHCIERHHIQAHFEARGQVVSPSTLRREFLLLKRLLTVAIEQWNTPIKSHPMQHLHAPPNAHNRTRRVSKTEWKAILEAANQQRNPLVPAVIQFAYETGMRRSEILNLRPSDIDLDMQTALLHDTKNGTPRTVPLSPEAIRIVQRHLQDCQDCVFNISPNAIRQAWQRILRKTGIQNLRFHDLRHEAVSRFFEMGMTIAEVQVISGHQDIRQLFRYTHLKASTIAEKYFK